VWVETCTWVNHYFIKLHFNGCQVGFYLYLHHDVVFNVKRNNRNCPNTFASLKWFLWARRATIWDCLFGLIGLCDFPYFASITAGAHSFLIVVATWDKAIGAWRCLLVPKVAGWSYVPHKESKAYSWSERPPNLHTTIIFCGFFRTGFCSLDRRQCVLDTCSATWVWLV